MNTSTGGFVKRSVSALALAVLAAGLFGWGYAAGAYQAFPYSLMSAAKRITIEASGGPAADYTMTDVPVLSAQRYDGLETRAAIVMVGDSITASGRWDEFFPEASILNRGVNGDVVGALEQRTQQILRAEPEKVFLLIGVNDVFARNATPAIMDRYERAARALQSGGARLYIQSVIPCRASHWTHCDARMQRETAALNSELRALSGEIGAVYVDLSAALAGPGGFLEAYSADGVHPNAAGFARWVEELRPHIEEPLA